MLAILRHSNSFLLLSFPGRSSLKARLHIYLFLLTIFFGGQCFAGGGDGFEKSYCSVLAGSTLVSNSSPLAETKFAEQTYASEFEQTKKIINIVSLSLFEESTDYIPANFTAKVTVKIDYGSSPTSLSPNPVTQVLTVDYNKTEGAKYNAKNYFTFSDAAYVKVTVVTIDAPTIGTYDTRKLLIVKNEMRVTRYYTLKSGVLPATLTHTVPSLGADELQVSWSWPDDAGQTHTQLEWTWVEDEMIDAYKINGVLSDNLLFPKNSTRLDLPRRTLYYAIPLLYGGQGKLYYRIRAVNIKADGKRTEGPWSARKEQAFEGHQSALNWQATTTYAEEGKRKTVVQYFDGSLRERQTVTKENVTGTTIVAETLYDGQGRPAVQILPFPSLNNVISYTAGLNLFKSNSSLNLPSDQQLSDDPAKFFDLQPLASTSNLTPELLNTTGSSKYYSTSNTQKDVATNQYIPDAGGYPYAVTRYMPDATGRIMAQSGVGPAMKMSSGHEAKYYYGTPAQEELDGLFGTEVGTYTHYFKNMIKDANGQMSVSYVDMHGRTIATALAGESPTNLTNLDITSSQYSNQQASTVTRNLLGEGSNAQKNNQVESINTLLVPAITDYQFRYELKPESLPLPNSTNPTMCYDCMYDLEISITDESGDGAPIVKRFNNINPNADDNCSTAISPFTGQTAGETALVSNNVVQFSVSLAPGSYIVRKTLTVSESSIQKYRDAYLAKSVTATEEQDLITSFYNTMSAASNCSAPPANSCSECNAALGLESDYRTKFLNAIGLNPAVAQAADVEKEITASYAAAKLHCERLCNTASQLIATKRSLMLADMIPYGGQYATGARPSTGYDMYDKYDIFSTANASTQPFYRKPWSSNKTPDFYYTVYNIKDPLIQPDGTLQKLSTTLPDEFANLFSYSWAKSLLPHHPEYDKLVFAENNLTPSYNWINTFTATTTYAQASTNGYIFTSSATLIDPFYTTAPGYKTAMVGYITGSYKDGLSMWQIAYGSVACKNIADPFERRRCFESAAKTPPYNSLTTAEKDRVWAIFRGLYAMERDNQVNQYIASNVPFPDAAETNQLILRGYKLHFPLNNNQLAQQLGPDWSWYPANPGDPPNTTGLPNGSTAAQVYSSRCNSYITQWRQALLQCPALNQNANKEQILADITAGMVKVCEKGSDEANPYGSSTVAPSTPSDGTPRSFEEVINNVFASYGISRTNLCNPFIIEFPKPYGNNPDFTKDMIAVVDDCNCKQLEQLKTDAAAAQYNPNVLSSLNQYLRTTYSDTLTQALFDEMTLNCAKKVSVCKDTLLRTGANCTDPVPCGCTLVQGSEGCYLDCNTRVCNEVTNTFALSSPQPMPAFIKCGYVAAARCQTCAQLSALTAEFKTLFSATYNAGPVFTGTDLSDVNIRDNVLYAQFLNYRTGFQYTWMDYAKAANANNCTLANYSINGSATQTVICSDSKPLTDPTGIMTTEDPCKHVYNMAVAMAQQIYKQRKEKLLADFESAYRAKCMSTKGIETFTVVYTNKEYHYTLYYYDMAGNLVKTVPPKGVRPDFSKVYTDQVEKDKDPAAEVYNPRPHVLVTSYRYNSLGQVIAQNSPDAKKSEFWYDRLGRLVVSRNAQQTSDGKYSYTLYDDLGRITEVGQKPQTTLMTQTISQDRVALNSWINTNGGTKEQITLTGYDVPYMYDPVSFPNGTLYGAITQKNLRNRVSYTQTKNLATDADHYTGTFYTYDIHGNVESLLQDYRGIADMINSNNQFKLIDYDYDLISGKVNAVAYQPGKPDAFYHRYNYDAENRLISVETSRDQFIWERDAAYNYYKHGPLARTELGQLRVQGVDYTYTLQGWLKGINPGASVYSTNNTVCQTGTALDDLTVTSRSSNTPSQYAARYSITFEGEFTSGATDEFQTLLDPNLTDCVASGGSTNTGTAYDEPLPVARDAYGFSLHYYSNDYTPIGTSAFNFVNVLTPLGTNAASLYNGNIAAMAVNMTKQNSPKVYNYHYDQLNRLLSMDAYNGLTNTAFQPIALDDYREQITYDPNGNILTYKRNGSTAGGKAVEMDDLSYNYYPNTNQLKQVGDNPAYSGNYPNDIDNQTNANNYTYDQIGNLKTDVSEGITGSGITWSVYGKILSVAKGTNTITYSYDASGNRISKTSSGALTVYVRDAQGNVMSVYEKPANGSIKQTEVHLYGSSRIGIEGAQTVASSDVALSAAYGTAKLSTFTRGEKNFELSNHLGNVLATINDKKLGTDANGDGTVDYYTADVLSTQDYYPFGMTMPGRASGTPGRYGFNGKELDKEASGTTTYDYGFRIYNPALGKFLSVDPLTKSYPWYTPYQFAGNTPIQAIDLDGGEPKMHVLEHKNSAGYHLWQNYYPSEHASGTPDNSRSSWSVYLMTDNDVQKTRYWVRYATTGGGNVLDQYTVWQWAPYDASSSAQFKDFTPTGSSKETARNVAKSMKGADEIIGYTLLGGLAAPFVIGGGAALTSEFLWTQYVNVGTKIYPLLPTIGATGRLVAEFLDETGSVGASNQGLKLTETVFQEAKGLLGATFKFENGKALDFLANKNINGTTLELTDMILYPQNTAGNEEAGKFGREAMMSVLDKLKEYAKSAGFSELRITFKRAENSSSANPGHTLDKTFNLNE